MSEFFSGVVAVYNETFFINANTGEGFDKLIRKIDPLLFKMSKTFYINGYSQEDLKQELAILAIEGVRAFNGSKNVKLSTFLTIHLHNKLISKIRSKNKLSDNATSISDSCTLPSVCECGSEIFLITEKFGEEISRECTVCDRIYKKEIRAVKREIGLGDVGVKSKDGDTSNVVEFIDTVAESDALYSAIETAEKAIELEASIEAICDSRGMDVETAKLLKLIGVNDYSIKEAADEVGISLWAATLKIKGLARNRKVRDMLGR